MDPIDETYPAAAALGPGTLAPDFRLPTTPDREAALGDYLGQPVILAFYPADWCPMCAKHLMLYNDFLPTFRGYHAALLGISVDGVWCHLAFSRARKLQFPLLADFEPKGAVARAYGVYRPRDGVPERALFVLDGEGTVRWSQVYPPGVNPGAGDILAALEALSAEPALT